MDAPPLAQSKMGGSHDHHDKKSLLGHRNGFSEFPCPRGVHVRSYAEFHRTTVPRCRYLKSLLLLFEFVQNLVQIGVLKHNGSVMAYTPILAGLMAILTPPKYIVIHFWP